MKGKIDNRTPNVQQEINLARTNARMSASLKGKPDLAQEKVLKFVSYQDTKKQSANNSISRGVDLIRAMAVLEGFKRSIKSTIQSMKVEQEDLGMFVYQMMESVKLAIVDPARHIQKAAINYIDLAVRALTQDSSQIAEIFQNLIRSINLKNVDPDDDIRLAKESYIEAAQFAEADPPEQPKGEL